ncbi:hypothetical protein [Epilithonimonas vandammei]|nr:hypothetical protein [Epilithonimonas vandammei]
MNRLNLDQFKKRTKTSTQKAKELEKLTGGILSDCHIEPTDFEIFKK